MRVLKTNAILYQWLNVYTLITHFTIFSHKRENHGKIKKFPPIDYTHYIWVQHNITIFQINCFDKITKVRHVPALYHTKYYIC